MIEVLQALGLVIVFTLALIIVAFAARCFYLGVIFVIKKVKRKIVVYFPNRHKSQQ